MNKLACITKHTRNVLVCVLAILLIIGFAGCGNTSPEKNAAGNSSLSSGDAAGSNGGNYDSELTEDRIVAWALGCSAILAIRNNLDPYQFGMFEKNDYNAYDAKSLLADSWGVNSRDDLIATVGAMTDNGHTAEFAEAYSIVSSLSEKELQELVESSDEMSAYMWPLTKQLGDKWGDKQIKAWDWFRMMHIAGWGYIAGYLEKEDAYDLMTPVIERLRNTFSSWEEANDNYMDGFVWWNRTDPSDLSNNYDYQRRVEIYDDLKALPPERTLFDPTLWPGYTPGETNGETSGDAKMLKYDDNGDGTCTITGFRWEQEDLSIPNEIDGLKVTVIGFGAFRGPNEFTGRLVIPDSVTIIEKEAFNYCDKLTGNLTIPGSVTRIGEKAFFGCKGFSGTLSLPEGIVEIGKSAFSRCEGLSGNLQIPGSVAKIESGAFSECTGFTSIEVSNQNPAYKSSEGVLFDKDGSTLIFAPDGINKNNYRIPDGTETIGQGAFEKCTGLTGTITLPDSVKTIESNAFNGCSGITEINIPNGVTTILNNTFRKCSGIKTIVIPADMTLVGNSAFQDCAGLATAEFRGDAPKTLKNSAFKGCAGDFKIVYDPSKSGWSTPEYNGYPCYPK